MIADIIIIAIMALCVFLGYKRGLIKVAVRIISFFAALVIALILYTPVSNYIIDNTEVVSNLKSTIQSKLYNEEETEESRKVQESFAESMERYTNQMKEESSEYIAEELAITVVRIGTWIGLFVIAKVLMLFVRIFAEAIGEIPIIKQFNKAGGTIYGILEGFVIIYVALAIFSLATPMLGENAVSKEIEESHICKMMYENNLLLNIIL